MTRKIFRSIARATSIAVAIVPTATLLAAPVSDEVRFRSLYRELVETNTTLSSGSCTVAAERMAAHLREAGFPASDLHIVIPAGYPALGSLVAILHGSDPAAKAILLVAHIDVVEAKREDWTRDPFTLVEEDGWFYARGSSDDKAQAAIWVDTLSRFKHEGYRPRRTIKMALTCGEEGGPVNGVEDLVANHRALVDAEFGLNEGAGGLIDTKGKHVALNIQAAQKFSQTYRIEVTNPGGHSSLPVRENAIYRLSDALTRLRGFEFPVEVNAATRGYFTAMANLVDAPVGPAMARFAANPADAGAATVIAGAAPVWNATLRTTCVATTLAGGHANSALPQRASANINCRIFPGTSNTYDSVRDTLVKVIDDPQVTVTALPPPIQMMKPPTLTEAVLGPARRVAREVFPKVPLVPIMSPGGNDGAVLTLAGIPTYGLTGFFHDAEGPRAHGLNERIRVNSLMDGRTFLYRLVKAYTAK